MTAPISLFKEEINTDTMRESVAEIVAAQDLMAQITLNLVRVYGVTPCRARWLSELAKEINTCDGKGSVEDRLEKPTAPAEPFSQPALIRDDDPRIIPGSKSGNRRSIILNGVRVFPSGTTYRNAVRVVHYIAEKTGGRVPVTRGDLTDSLVEAWFVTNAQVREAIHLAKELGWLDHLPGRGKYILSKNVNLSLAGQ